MPDHNQWHTHTHTVSKSPLDGWSARRRDFYLHNTKQRKETGFHVSGGIRTRNSNKRAAADPRLKTHSHWDRPTVLRAENFLTTWISSNNWNMASVILISVLVTSTHLPITRTNLQQCKYFTPCPRSFLFCESDNLELTLSKTKFVTTNMCRKTWKPPFLISYE